jgi:hypothetical protein
MNKQDKLQFDVRTIVEDAIDSLRMHGLTNQASLELLMIQSAIRMSSAARARALKSISDMMTVDDDNNDDDHCGND